MPSRTIVFKKRNHNINIGILFSLAVMISSCTILPCGTLLECRKARGKYELHLFESADLITFGKGNHFTVTCGKMFQKSTCYGRYSRQDSLFVIEKVNRNCFCLESTLFVFKDSVLYELKADSSVYNRWYVND